ncbi:MAG TPA: nuclear transport factor 2 family protein [Chitinophagaceae bacterium]
MKTIKYAIQFLLAGIIICSSPVRAQSIGKIDAENLIKNFFTGFEKKDWNMVASQLSEDFTFTSPNNDDHINVTQYKEKCWATGSKLFKKIEFLKIVPDGNTAFAMYTITTTDNKIFHNVEYYTFSNGKIKSIETFFGTGTYHPGNSGNAK